MAEIACKNRQGADDPWGWGVKVVCTGRQAGRQQGHQAREVRRLVTCMGMTVRGRLESRLHLHDDGFLGDFCLLLSDYKENSRNSNRYTLAVPGGRAIGVVVANIATCLM